MPQEGTEVQVRAGTAADLAALTEIYNHYVRETPITFDTAPFTPEQRRDWLLSYPEDGPYRLLVAQDVPNVDSSSSGCPAGSSTAGILGYATSSPFRPKAAYSTSVEVSVYCAPRATGRGIGTLLYEALFEALKDEDLHRAYAGIAVGTSAEGGGANAASARLHARFGFRHIGTYEQVGRKFGRYWDVAWYEKRLTQD
ncbi:GNAT family N-acetyltransferase [Streptomyces sp. NPDC002889]|uniref:GNAT family N-acetyltransferase n=1 Tax=Streptomyces sp. NPDC002889 TaxID=3364669 RepID=UPI00368CF65D